MSVLPAPESDAANAASPLRMDITGGILLRSAVTNEKDKNKAKNVDALSAYEQLTQKVSAREVAIYRRYRYTAMCEFFHCDSCCRLRFFDRRFDLRIFVSGEK